MINIRKYTADNKQEWDNFVRKSKNATFLFLRDYMDYHSNRFCDHSLMFYYEEKLVALLPLATKISEEKQSLTLSSHPGLTYGGLIMGKECTTVKICRIFDALTTYLKEQGVKELIYKAIPHIYHKYPAEEDLYALNAVCKATLMDRKIASIIDMTQPLQWRKGKHANMVAARREGITVVESDDFSAFWPIVEDNLKIKYCSKPIHTLQEMELLHQCFPQNIRLLLAQKDGKTLSGTVLYVTDTCVHTQYLNSSEEGNRYHCNELVIDHVLKNFSHLRYFDYGTSADDGAFGLNEALISSKEGYGCRGVVYDVYLVKV